MAAKPEGPFIKAAGFRADRSRQRWGGIRFVVLHTAEGSTDEQDLGRYFQSQAGSGGSSHCGVGQDGGIAYYVQDSHTAWTNPPVNDDSLTVEICGFARWSKSEWLAHDAMLTTTARWVAWACQANGLPVRRLTAAQIRNGDKGITSHVDVNAVFGESDHSDPGPNFPWVEFLAKVESFLGSSSSSGGSSVAKPTNPAPGFTVNCPFGKQGSMWSTGRHEGVDLNARSGSTVVAPWNATVTSAQWGSAYGTHVVLDFDNLPDGRPGYWGVLAHLSSKNVSPGQRVTAGQVIGKSGATGNVSGPHLHFEVINNSGNWGRGMGIDPSPWVGFDCKVVGSGGSTSSSSSSTSSPQTGDDDVPEYRYASKVRAETIPAGQIASLDWDYSSWNSDHKGVSSLTWSGSSRAIIHVAVGLSARPDWVRVARYQKQSDGSYKATSGVGPAVDLPDLGGGAVYSFDAQGAVGANDVLRVEIKAPDNKAISTLAGTGIFSAFYWAV